MGKLYGSLEDTKLRPGAHILYENQELGRANYTVAAGGSYTVATVMGRVTADGKLKPVDAAANDGTENAHSVLIRDCDAFYADEIGLVNKSHAKLRADMLVWPAGATQVQIDGWLAQLEAKHIEVQ